MRQPRRRRPRALHRGPPPDCPRPRRRPRKWRSLRYGQYRTGDRHRIFEQGNDEVPSAERLDQADAGLKPGECANHAADGPERCTEGRRLIARDRDGGPGNGARYDTASIEPAIAIASSSKATTRSRVPSALTKRTRA